MTVETTGGRRGRAMLAGRAPGAASAITLVLVMTGCTSTGITLRDSSELKPCEVADTIETVTIPVEDLSQYGECDLAGVWLLYPTGDTREVGAPAVNSGGDASDDSVIGWTNWGPDGVAAWRQTDDSVTVWGTPAGVQLSIRGMAEDGRAEGSPARPTTTATP
ncbi:hypothetical protein ACTHAM_001057 [Cellulomonas soli]|uniref:hypothetical protein n=1 Tax=Cellulomonas soli TaxID=931535 RepID=UPI003F8295D2